MVYENYEETIDQLQRSLTTNSEHVTLLNNLAYCYACLGQVREADKILSQIDTQSLSGSSQIAVLATNGLVFFRRGLVDQGRYFYKTAIEKASQSPAFAKMRAMASILLAREEVIANSPGQEESVKAALMESRSRKEPDLLLQVDRLKALVSRASSPTIQG